MGACFSISTHHTKRNHNNTETENVAAQNPPKDILRESSASPRKTSIQTLEEKTSKLNSHHCDDSKPYLYVSDRKYFKQTSSSSFSSGIPLSEIPGSPEELLLLNSDTSSTNPATIRKNSTCKNVSASSVELEQNRANEAKRVLKKLSQQKLSLRHTIEGVRSLEQLSEGRYKTHLPSLTENLGNAQQDKLDCFQSVQTCSPGTGVNKEVSWTGTFDQNYSEQSNIKASIGAIVGTVSGYETTKEEETDFALLVGDSDVLEQEMVAEMTAINKS